MNSKCIANNENIILSFKYSVNDKNHLIDKITSANEKCNKTISNLFK